MSRPLRIPKHDGAGIETGIDEVCCFGNVRAESDLYRIRTIDFRMPPADDETCRASTFAPWPAQGKRKISLRNSLSQGIGDRRTEIAPAS
jgi:hypothetical protein